MKMEELLNKVIQGDCLEVMRGLPESSVDSIVTDPPYELGFMGKSWDSTGIANNVEMWREALRVLKPGGHLLSFSGTRTYHRMAVAIEDAGFEVRDMIEWVYGSGFPKSLNIGKAVDKLQGNEREFIAKEKTQPKFKYSGSGKLQEKWIDKDTKEITKGTSEWEGWGTALKPAHEPICMARKPLAEKTVAENCLKWGTGGINIDESRVGTDVIKSPQSNGVFAHSGNGAKQEHFVKKNADKVIEVTGRFPANLLHDNSEEVRECFPETKTGAVKNTVDNGANQPINLGGGLTKERPSDSGNASRFFKSIKKDDSIYAKKIIDFLIKIEWDEIDIAYFMREIFDFKETNKDKFFKSIIYQAKASKSERGIENRHPTVKPIALMEYLIKMVTPKNGIVLDPFTGSGSTLLAAKKNGFNFIGIEQEPEYCEIARKRLGRDLPLAELLKN